MKNILLITFATLLFSCQKESFNLKENNVTVEEKGKSKSTTVKLYENNSLKASAVVLFNAKRNATNVFNPTNPITLDAGYTYLTRKTKDKTLSDTIRVNINPEIWCDNCQFKYGIILENIGTNTKLLHNGVVVSVPAGNMYEFTSNGDEQAMYLLSSK
jgi:hypothetical protein